MVPTELTVQMQSVWCQDHVIAHTVHTSVPLIVVIAQVPESFVILAEAVAAVGVVNTIVFADVAVDIAASSEAADILTKINHGLARCLSLHTYHILQWV